MKTPTQTPQAPGFDATLLAWLRAHQMQQKQFAEQLGVTRMTISNWCRGASRPDTKERCREIKRLTGIPLKKIRPDWYPPAAKPQE